MRNNQHQEEEQEGVEILKAVAQAWHGHSIHCKTTAATSEFDARRLFFNGRPSRFKVEAMRTAAKRDLSNTSWDFGRSLWDSYEIVTVSKKLETGLVVDGDPFSEQERVAKRHKESKNSLRNLFNRMSSRKFKEDEL